MSDEQPRLRPVPSIGDDGTQENGSAANRDAEQSDPSVMQSYMTSETGRVYLLLAHASGRLR